MKEHPRPADPPWTRDRLAEAFRILGVHSAKRLQLADAFTQSSGPWTLPQLAELSGIKRQKIYHATAALRDNDILQPTRPTEPRLIMLGRRAQAKKRRETGANGPAQYVFNRRRLAEAIEEKAREASDQIRDVLPEAQR